MTYVAALSVSCKQQIFIVYVIHQSHKERKDSLDTRDELAVLRTYVDNQAILAPILLYRASKCKQT